MHFSSLKQIFLEGESLTLSMYVLLSPSAMKELKILAI